MQILRISPSLQIRLLSNSEKDGMNGFLPHSPHKPTQIAVRKPGKRVDTFHPYACILHSTFKTRRYIQESLTCTLHINSIRAWPVLRLSISSSIKLITVSKGSSSWIVAQTSFSSNPCKDFAWTEPCHPLDAENVDNGNPTIFYARTTSVLES